MHLKSIRKVLLSLVLLFVGRVVLFGQVLDQQRLLDYYEQQRYGDAADYIQSVYKEPINDKQVMSRLAYNYRMAANYPRAIHYYEQLLALDSLDKVSLLSLGQLSYQRGLTQQAITYFKKLLQQDSTHLQALTYLGDIAKQRMDLPDAIHYYQQANQLYPANADVAFDLATLLLQLKLNEQADQVLVKSLESDQGNLLLMKLRLGILFNLKRYAETIALALQLREMGDDTDKIEEILAPSYYFTGQYAQSIVCYSKLEENNELNEGSLYYKAMCYQHLDSNARAIEYLDKTLKAAISENVASYYAAKGQSYEAMAKPKNALASYQKSFQFKEIALNYFSIAALYDLKLKSPKTALKYYKVYLKSEKDLKNNKKYIAYATQRIAGLSEPEKGQSRTAP